MIDQKFIRECFDYDPATGVVKWRVRPLHHFPNEKTMKSFNTSSAGKIAGSLSKRGSKTYRQVSINDRNMTIHRLIWIYMTGEQPDEIDHINGDGADNRWCNLREVDRRQNNKNMRKSSANNSGVTGVHWDNERQKWRSEINNIQGVSESKRFDDLLDAVAWRKSAENRYGYHQNHGSDRPL